MTKEEHKKSLIELLEKNIELSKQLKAAVNEENKTRMYAALDLVRGTIYDIALLLLHYGNNIFSETCDIGLLISHERENLL